MKRRGFLAGMAAVVAVPDVGYAEQTQNVRRIAVLWHGSPGAIHMREPFVMRLRELGWRENQNVSLNGVTPKGIPSGCRLSRPSWSRATLNSSWPASARSTRR
jgi:hypothetical protein